VVFQLNIIFAAGGTNDRTEHPPATPSSSPCERGILQHARNTTGCPLLQHQTALPPSGGQACSLAVVNEPRYNESNGFSSEEYINSGTTLGCVKYFSARLLTPEPPVFLTGCKRWKRGEEGSTQGHAHANPAPCRNPSRSLSPQRTSGETTAGRTGAEGNPLLSPERKGERGYRRWTGLSLRPADLHEAAITSWQPAMLKPARLCTGQDSGREEDRWQQWGRAACSRGDVTKVKRHFAGSAQLFFSAQNP